MIFFYTPHFFFFNVFIKIILQPRRFKFKVRQKTRSFLKPKKHCANLIYGSAGLMIFQPLYLNGTQIFRLKLFLKRATKKSDVTFRQIWFYAFPHLPLSKKPDGIRMGKGKGKLNCWFCQLAPGNVLFELKNLRLGRSVYFLKQTTHKLGILTKFLFAENHQIVTPYSSSYTMTTSYFF